MGKLGHQIFLLIFFLYVIPASSQTDRDNQQTIDSLESVLSNSFNTNVSNKHIIELCDTLSKLYNGRNHSKTIEFAIRSLKSAEKENNIDLQITPLGLLGNTYFLLDDYEKSIMYYARLADIYIQQNKELEVAWIYLQLGSTYKQWSKFDLSKSYYEKSIRIYKQYQNFEGIAFCMTGIASILTQWGYYDRALLQYLEALKFWEETGSEAGVAQSYNHIGMLYQELGDFERANDFYIKALLIFEELKDTWHIVNMTLHIGDIYMLTKNYEKALDNFFKALEIEKEVGNKKLQAIALSNIGEVYNRMGYYQKALDYQYEALTLKKALGDKKRLSITYSELGNIYKNLGQYTKAVDFLQIGLDLALEINSKYQINTSYKYFSEVYSSTEDYKKAFDYYKKYTEGLEDVNSMKSKKVIAQLQSQYQLEKKEKENNILRNTEDLSKAKIKIQQLVIILAGIILIAALSLAFVFRRREKQKKRLNIQMALKNKKIEHQGERVQKLNTELQEANATKDKFFSILAHDLKNPFNSLILLTEVLIDDINTFSKEEIIEYLEKIKASSENTYILLQNLLEWAGSQTGKHEIFQQKLDAKTLVEETISLLAPNAENKEISIYPDFLENYFIYADKNMIATVLLNLMSNAIKFTPRKGKINVSIEKDNQFVVITISDNGVGISAADSKNLFRIDKKIQHKGTEKEPGTGLGLILCKEFVEKNHGKIWAESQPSEGSKFHFSIPVA